jgi:hypothetical protein
MWTCDEISKKITKCSYIIDTMEHDDAIRRQHKK